MARPRRRRRGGTITAPEPVVAEKPKATIQLQMTNQSGLFDHVKENRQYCEKVCTEGFGEGKTVVIIGSGPSTLVLHDEIKSTKAHQFWAANSSVPYCYDNGLPLSHGISVDQSPEMYTKDWSRTFPIKYLLSSCVDPNLTRHLLAAKRDIRWFHSFIGIPDPEGWEKPKAWIPPKDMQLAGYEMWLYQHTWPATCMVGYGLNTVPRAICLALWAGFKKIIVFGADCACLPDGPEMVAMSDPAYPEWLDKLVLYPDGRTPRIYGDQAVIAQSTIDGRRWHTRPDMLISAQHLCAMVKLFPDRIDLRGDILPKVLMQQTQEWWKTMPHLGKDGNIEGFELKR